MRSPGLTPLLKDFGIGLCIDLLQLGFFPLQGPLVQIGAGLNIFFASFKGWVKFKTANGSPMCPQDWSADMLSNACGGEGKYYDAFYDLGKKKIFCQLDPANGHSSTVGATISLDFFFWARSWEWAVQPPRRDIPKCPNGHEYGPQARVFENEVCVDAAKDYLDSFKEVKADPAWNTRPHDHYLQIGRAKGYIWPGRQCRDEELGFASSAQQMYYFTYPDVKNDINFGVNSRPFNGAYRHYQAVTTSDNLVEDPRIWHGELAQDDWNEVCPESISTYLAENKDVAADSNYGPRPRRHWIDHVLTKEQAPRQWKGDLCAARVSCASASQDYLVRYGDVAANEIFSKNPFDHYTQYGRAEGRRWKGHLCAMDAGEKQCDGAKAVYSVINGDVLDAGVDAWAHFNTAGRSEGRIWPGNMC